MKSERRVTVGLFDDGHVDGVVREQDFADVAEQDVDSLFAVDFLVAVHRDHDGRVKLWVVNLEKIGIFQDVNGDSSR